MVRTRLTSARAAIGVLRGLVAEAGPGSVGRVLKSAYDNGLVDPVPQLACYLNPDGPRRDQVLSDKTREILDAFMACDVREIEGYLLYVSRQSGSQSCPRRIMRTPQTAKLSRLGRTAAPGEGDWLAPYGAAVGVGSSGVAGGRAGSRW
ncbi:hypothetical protein GCM10010399_07360 [Dactylosporangium fulvum]